MSVEVGDAATEHPLALRPGSILDDRYRLLRLLSGSSCAASYLAQDDRTNELVLIEEFLPRSLVTRHPNGGVCPHTPNDEAEFYRAAKRFAREGERLAEIDHPNLLRVRRAFEANGTAYVVMAHREAVPLQGFVAAAGGRLAPAPATELVRRLLDALEAMHADGVFHRNLSPVSVQVDGAGRPVLQSVSASRQLPSQARDLVDGYAPIELYGSRGVGPWTDVYSASALLYYLLTGSAPASAIDRAAGQMLVAPTTIVAGLSPSLVAALMRGLAQLPEQRPHSASEFSRLLSGSGQATSAPPAAAAPLPPQPLAAIQDVGATEQSQSQSQGGPQASAIGLPFDATALRFASGLVMPEHDNLTGRVKKWLSAYRRGGDETSEEDQAILDAASRMMASPPPAAPNYAAAQAQPIQPVAPPTQSLFPMVARPAPTVPPPVLAPAPAPVAPAPVAPAPVAPAPVALVPVALVPIASVSVSQAPVEPPPVELAPPELMPAKPAPLAATPIAPRPALPPVQLAAQLEPETIDEKVPLHVEVERLAPRESERQAERAATTDKEDQRSSFEFALTRLESELPTISEDFGLAESDESANLPAVRPWPRLRMGAITGRRATKALWSVAAVLLLGGAVAGAAYASRTSNGVGSPVASTGSGRVAPSAPVTVPAAADSTKSYRAEASGAILQGSPSSGADSARGSRTERPRPTAERASEPPADKPPVLTGLSSVNVSVASSPDAPQLLPADVVIDIRDRLAQGRLLADGGDYAAARRTFKAALSAIDSAAARYMSSDALRTMRRDVEKESQSALDACNAENTIRQRREGKSLACS